MLPGNLFYDINLHRSCFSLVNNDYGTVMLVQFPLCVVYWVHSVKFEDTVFFLYTLQDMT